MRVRSPSLRSFLGASRLSPRRASPERWWGSPTATRFRSCETDAPCACGWRGSIARRGARIGARAEQFTSEMAFGKDAAVEVRDVDRYGRLVARVTVGGESALRRFDPASRGAHSPNCADFAAISASASSGSREYFLVVPCRRTPRGTLRARSRRPGRQPWQIDRRDSPVSAASPPIPDENTENRIAATRSPNPSLVPGDGSPNEAGLEKPNRGPAGGLRGGSPPRDPPHPHNPSPQSANDFPWRGVGILYRFPHESRCGSAPDQRIAIGATVDPVPPLILSGCTTKANSWTRSAARTSSFMFSRCGCRAPPAAPGGPAARDPDRDWARPRPASCRRR